MPQAKRDPWASVIDFGVNENTSQPDNYSSAIDFAPPPASQAPPSAPAQPRVTTIPTARAVDPRNPNPLAPLVAGTDQVEFGDGSGATGPNRRLDPAQENQLMTILWKGPIDSAAPNARAYMASIGWPVPPTAFEDSVAARKQGQKPGWLQYDKAAPLSDPNQAQSAIAGAASDIPGVNKIESLIDSASVSLGLGGQGDPNQSFGNNYRSTLDRVEATDDKARENHPYYYGGGELAGLLAIPTDAPAFASRKALEAGSEVLRAGQTMADARDAAQVAYRRALGNRTAIEGAAYGGALGVGNADNFGDAVKDSAIGAVTGGVGGKVFGDVGARIFGNPTVSAAARNTMRPVADIASDLGVQPTPASVGGAPATMIQTGMASLPGASSAVTAASDGEIAGLGNATRRVAEGFGEPGTPASSGEALVGGAQAYRASSRAEATGLYNARDAAMNGPDAPVILRNSGDFGKSIVAALPNEVVRKLGDHPIVSKILGITANDGGEITLADATEALSQVRAVKRNLGPTESGQTIKRVGDLESALEKDVYESATAADQAAGRIPGEPGSAVKAQRDADAFYADRAATLKGPLGKALASGKDPTKISAESVYGQLASDTAAKGGNLDRLRKTWFRLPEETRGRFAATLLDDMGRPQVSNRTLGARFMEAVGLKGNDEARMSDGFAWSPETFLTGFNKMSPQARRVVFGKEGEAQIADIARYASKLRETGRFRNFSNTAKSTLTAGALYAVGSALAHGQLLQGGEEAAGIYGAYLGAKVFLATPKMRAWTLNALKAATLPPKAQEAAQKVLLSRLPGIARAEPVFGPQILDLKRALSGAATSSPNFAAANEPGNSAGVTDWDDPKYESETYSPDPAGTDTMPQSQSGYDPNADPSIDDGTDGNNTDWAGQ